MDITTTRSLASGYASQHIAELVPKPRNREGYSRNGNWHKNTSGCIAGLTLALICVAAAGQLVVIQ